MVKLMDETKLRKFMEFSLEQSAPMRDELSKSENVELVNDLALGLIDVAMDLHSERDSWESAEWQFAARMWWHHANALPSLHLISVEKALRLNGMLVPGLIG